MSAVLTRDQADLLRAKSRGWAMARLIAHTDAAISDEKQGMHGGTGGTWWFDTDSRGVHGTRTADLHRITYGQRGREHLVHVTWAELRRAVKALPARLVSDVTEAYATWHVHYQRRMVRPYNPANVAMVPWVDEDPQLLRDAETRMRAAVDAALDALPGPVDLPEEPGQLDLFAVAS